MAVGDDRANDVLDAIFGTGHHSSFPSTVYLALYYEEPDDAGGGTEADYVGYARVSIANNDTNFPPAVDRETVLATDVAFPDPPSATSRFVAWAIHGHATNDDIIIWETFTNPVRSTGPTDPITIDADTLVIPLDSILD